MLSQEKWEGAASLMFCFNRTWKWSLQGICCTSEQNLWRLRALCTSSRINPLNAHWGRGAHTLLMFTIFKKKTNLKKTRKMGGGSAQDQVFQALLFCINYAQYLTGIHFFFLTWLQISLFRLIIITNKQNYRICETHSGHKYVST